MWQILVGLAAPFAAGMVFGAILCAIIDQVTKPKEKPEPAATAPSQGGARLEAKELELAHLEADRQLITARVRLKHAQNDAKDHS